MSKEERFDLEERLLDFAVRVIKVSESLPNTRADNHVRGQILRSGTSPAPNYAEAQSAESRGNFVHKVKVVLKELRETKVWRRMIVKAELITPPSKLEPLIAESNELISIFVASVKTASKNRSQPSPPDDP
jgi:four helix bundle protein